MDLEKRLKSNNNRDRLYNKLYLADIIKNENPVFKCNNLILAPVGSGKSFLIENTLIPKDFSGKVLYLTSNTALKDSISPNDLEARKNLADKDKSLKFFTSGNKRKFGDRKYQVHVMTYHEFGRRILSPNETFTKDIDLIFCDEIHSLPIFTKYGLNGELLVALRWLFQIQENKTIFYFTATRESLDEIALNNLQEKLKTRAIRNHKCNERVSERRK